MTIFGIKEAIVASLIREVSREEHSADGAPVTPTLDPADIVERFARATWTGIAEPGDRVAGALIAATGAVDALAAVVDRRSPAKILSDAGRRGDVVARDSSLRDDPLGTDLDVSEEDLTAALARWHPRVSSNTAVIALRQAARYGVSLLIPGDPAWPVGVDDLGDHAPLALWLRGRSSTLASVGTSLALVGARAATGYGEHVTMEASAGLVDRGYTIVSGAAYGIDGMAHRAALASSGQTVAFLAGGVDRFYPSGHDALLSRIVEVGAVVSELPCGAPPTKWRFLQRNRLIAAASQATIVLEAGWRSGSLNTAGHAAALGRPLGAVPGPVTSAASAGCHRLIRDFDAVCVTTADEMAELAPLDGNSSSDTRENGGRDNGPLPDAVRVIDALSPRSPRTADDIAARAGLSIGQVQSVLGVLEIESRVRSGERGWSLIAR